MAHDPTGTRAVHLVGSVPLESAEMVFRSVSKQLGPFVLRIPDGETGDRTGWVGFQIPMFTQHPAMELVPSQAKGEGEGNLDSVARGEAEDYTRPVFRLRPSATVAALSFDDLGYSTAARASYAVFAELRRVGAIRPGTRFQVSLPTPLAPLVMFVARRDLLAVEPAFRAAMLRELGQICSAIPHDDLAVQWDVAPEMALLEGVWESVLDDVERAVIERLVELGNAVPRGVALGYHLCYGGMPVLLAKAAATLDRLVSGRFHLGLGAGAYWDGIASIGGVRRSPGNAVDALSEASDVIRLMWTGEPAVHYDGRHHRLAGVEPGPRPEHDIGIWLGAYGPRMLGFVGSKADGWMPSSPYAGPAEVAVLAARVDDAAAAAGRDPASILRVYNVFGRIRDDPSDEPFTGPTVRWVDVLVALALDSGFDTFLLWPSDAPIPALERFTAEVIPEVRSLVAKERSAPGP